MKSLVTTGNPGELALADRPEPAQPDDHALIEVRAAGVNRGELALTTVLPAGSPLGWDVYGTVLRAAPDGTGPAEGTAVVGLADRDGWAERAVIPVDRLAAVPDPLGRSAAAIPVAGLTALYAIRASGSLLGRTVLITGAGGGVGRFAVQLAAIAGARVLASTSSARRADGLTDLGAAEVLGYRNPPDEPIDVLLDGAGGEVLGTAYSRVAAGGSVICYGNTAREELRLPADWGHARPGVTLHYLFLFRELAAQPVARDLAYLVGLAAGRELDPQIATTVSWTEAGSALHALHNRELNGKALLTL
ncbi:hypothetical protein ED92_40175 [Amycolatopsis sp. MJM2582]|uniref:zinc-binding dehydrogenase n=1 Tax=Amycolatopsis TaxID=1813 RepID=UPI000505A9FB|nr:MULTISPECIES: zinc-binding dehydrogenase [unclassified Amycolatopsis]KFZ76905.1 hypothetical protein ED92_40175 [Amycolatopsis sp. MJM2582]RSN39562.1 alcohol dehydrogenase [Amycolatopsis sp. WAC 04197]